MRNGSEVVARLGVFEGGGEELGLRLLGGGRLGGCFLNVGEGWRVLRSRIDRLVLVGVDEKD